MADKPTANRWQTIQTKKYQKKDKVKKETTTKNMENNMGKTAYEYVTVYALLSLRLHTPYTTNESLNWFNQALTRSTNTNKKRREKNLFIPPPPLSNAFQAAEKDTVSEV